MPDVPHPPSPPAPPAAAGVVADDDQPLIAVPLDEEDGGRRRVAYYTSEAAADAALDDAAIRRAKALAGAWADLDWEEVAAELHRIRHQTPPSPPADEVLGAALGADEDAAGAAP
jgi:hypothetical protein